VLAWDPSSDDVGVVGYGVYRGALPVDFTSEPTVTLGGLACGSTYQYAVDALDAAGNRSQRSTAWVQTAECTDGQPPSTPTGLATSNVSQTGLTLTWNASSDNVGVTSYDVALGGVSLLTVTQPSATLQNLTCGTTYSVGVAASDAAGNRSPASTISAFTEACAPAPPPPAGDTTPPSQPGNLLVSASTATSVSLTWAASTDDVAVSGYGLYVDGDPVSSATLPAATISGLACGSAYTLAVDAYDAAGNRSTKASAIATTAACADTQAPTVPADVRATSRTATSIALSWSPSSDNTGVVGYGLYRGGALVGTTAVTTGIFSGLTCNANYTLAVDAYDAAGNRSQQTTVMVATTACPDTTPPSTPSGLAASDVSETGLTLTWNASSDDVGVAGYDVYRNGTKTASVSSTSSSQTGLACGTSYSFALEAYDAAGNRSAQASLNAATAACSPPPPPPPPPSGTPLACGSSLDAAYDAAPPGTLIELQNCSYTGKTITGTKAAPGVVFDLNGSDQGSLDAQATNVEFRDGRAGIDAGCTSGVVFRNISTTGIFWNGVCGLTMIGGEIGPQASDQLNWIYSDKGYAGHDIVLDGVYIHDNRCVSAGCHYEAIRIDRNVHHVTIKNSIFERNAIFHIFVTSLTGSQLSTDLTFENNVFDQPTNGWYAIKTHEPFVSTCTNYTIRGNHFSYGDSSVIGLFCPTKVGVTVEGNTFG